MSIYRKNNLGSGHRHYGTCGGTQQLGSGHRHYGTCGGTQQLGSGHEHFSNCDCGGHKTNLHKI